MLWLNLSSKSITATDCVLIFLAILYIYLFIFLVITCIIIIIITSEQLDPDISPLSGGTILFSQLARMKTGLIEALLRLLWNVSGPWGSGESEFLKRVPVESQVSVRNYKEEKKIVQTKQMSRQETCVNRTETPSCFMSRQTCESVFTWAVPVSRSWEDNLSYLS